MNEAYTTKTCSFCQSANLKTISCRQSSWAHARSSKIIYSRYSRTAGMPDRSYELEWGFQRRSKRIWVRPPLHANWSKCALPLCPERLMASSRWFGVAHRSLMTHSVCDRALLMSPVYRSAIVCIKLRPRKTQLRTALTW